MKNLSIKNSIMMLILVAVLSSCSQGESLQSYFVFNQEKADFMSVDIPANFLNLDDQNLTDEQMKAYESMNKLNMLGFTKTESNQAVYEAELVKVRALLKDPKYQELFRGGSSTDGKITVKYIGDDDSIDELIIFGTANDKGFAIVRVLGDNMEPGKIMQLGDVVKDLNFESSDLKQFTGFFQ